MKPKHTCDKCGEPTDYMIAGTEFRCAACRGKIWSLRNALIDTLLAILDSHKDSRLPVLKQRAVKVTCDKVKRVFVANIEEASRADSVTAQLSERAWKHPKHVRTALEATLKEARREILETASISGKPGLEYFELSLPDGDAYCSDSQCPCADTVIPRGEGYLYISPDVVEFRSDAQSHEEMRRKVENVSRLFGGKSVVLHEEVSGGILMCEVGAKRRNLNLRMAASDAAYWWKTGMAPLRATPSARK